MNLEEAMYQFYSGLEVLGPGSRDTTARLLKQIPIYSKGINALDIGCGTGRSSIVLASHGINVTAVDDYKPFLDSLNKKANVEGVEERISTVNMSMDQLDFPENSFDIVWSEASAYVLGFEKALHAWKNLIKPSGYMVISECCWTSDDPPKEALDFWSEEYPGMLKVAEAQKIAEGAGFEIVDKLTLPETDWENYYNPLKNRAEEFENDSGPEMKLVIENVNKEIAVREKFHSEYDYVAFILKPSEKI